MTRLKVKRTKPKARNQAVVASPRAAGRLAAGLREVIEEWDNDHPEHIERKVFEAISALLNENLIRGAEGKLGLADTLGILFGADSEMKREGEKFERLINGYFGEVDWDDMEEAQNILEEIISELEQLARHDKDSEPKLFSDTHDENK
jgi:hypothetical protein